MASEDWNWRRQREKKAFLALEDGTVYHGCSVGFAQDRVGEVVFNTSMTGYQEILTDPSYNGQFVVMTNPEIGNTGVNQDDAESAKLFLEGFIVRQLNAPSNWRSQGSLEDYLIRHQIPALAGVDTRALTLALRHRGTLRGCLAVEGKMDAAAAVDKARQWPGLDGVDRACQVTADSAFEWDADGDKTSTWGMQEPLPLPKPERTVVAYDFGIKWNLARRLRLAAIGVQVVPAGTTAREIMAMRPDGLFLSNGPADPAALKYAIDNIRSLIGRLPMMGVCMGHQLLALALGGGTYRLKFGHHGANHPVQELRTGKVAITAQNHNFCVDSKSLPATVAVSHVNLNDQTVEGLEHRREPLFSVQYHPEAAPGPHDSLALFDRFRGLMQ